jgi:Spy/CpxP family protein refolding chaperone
MAAALVLLAASAQAQNPAPRAQRPGQQRPPMQQMQPGDSGQMMAPGMGPGGPGGPGQGGPRMEMLRQQVEERFGRMVQAELQLSEPQMQQLRSAMHANQDRRRDIFRHQQDVQRAIGQQLQPGQAANADSLNRLLNAGGQTRVDLAQSDQQFMRDLAFLTPVQRARLIMMTQRFEERMREIVQQRRGGMGPSAEPGQRRMPRMQRRPM